MLSTRQSLNFMNFLQHLENFRCNFFNFCLSLFTSLQETRMRWQMPLQMLQTPRQLRKNPSIQSRFVVFNSSQQTVSLSTATISLITTRMAQPSRHSHLLRCFIISHMFQVSTKRQKLKKFGLKKFETKNFANFIDELFLAFCRKISTAHIPSLDVPEAQ